MADEPALRTFLKDVKGAVDRVDDAIDPGPGPLPEPPKPPKTTGAFISSTELHVLPTTGASWEAVKRTADGAFEKPGLGLRNRHNVQVYAASLAAVALDSDELRAKVRDELAKTQKAGVNTGDALATCRRLGTYAIAAEVAELNAFDQKTGQQFWEWVSEARYAKHSGGGGGGSVVSIHERRPNNYGTHAFASRVAVAVCIDDQDDLKRAAQVHRSWLGEGQSAYPPKTSPNQREYFDFGDLSWQGNQSEPVGVNGPRFSKQGRDIDGVLADDQRRAGGFSWPPAKENYVWEALQGAVVGTHILVRAGYQAWEWSDSAILRAVMWLHEQCQFPAEGDDGWVPHLVNKAYRTEFPGTVGSIGKNLGFTDWTHGAAA